ncbi:Hydrogen peroxide-inducible activator [Legionella birminghamensis]|uniref:Hydrogen peroxide-inducible activator n=1 Tax=Legionella birminghamensis TaxID=28083 RepID=A0A378IC01_9GAMM|nr:LysR substrate-binding domain-containing protein [Legionella birminghamensis]KTC73063.1 Hydrogen peroxide-inducible activator [Legionella birminghamensis]STX32360.1 hydrogen peroxide-inducible genes activator [Legionella birminghamensis]
MNLRDLHYFVVLAKTQHFGDAAKLCHISQPTLSMQLKKLEDELGIKLFERSNRQVILTEAGRKVLAKAQSVLHETQELKDMAESLSDPLSGELRLGVIPTLAPYFLPLIMPQIQKRFPKLRVWLIEEQTHRLSAKLAQGDLDAAIMATPVEADFESVMLFKEPFYFAYSKNYPFSKNGPIKLNDLAEQSVLLLEEGHCLREQAMDICRSAKAKTSVDFTATSLETLRLMVESGLGVTLLPALAVRNITENLKVLPFAEPVPYRTIALYYRAQTVKLECLQLLAKLIEGIINPLVQ